MILDVRARWSQPMQAFQCPACRRTFWNPQWRSNPCACGLEYVEIQGTFWMISADTPAGTEPVDWHRTLGRSPVYDATPF